MPVHRGCMRLMNEIANIADDVRAPFEVKVSVDQGTTYGQDKQMKSYHCAVDQNSYRLNEVNEILSSMWANTTMKEWVMGLPACVCLLSSHPSSHLHTTNATPLQLNLQRSQLRPQHRKHNLPPRSNPQHPNNGPRRLRIHNANPSFTRRPNLRLRRHQNIHLNRGHRLSRRSRLHASLHALLLDPPSLSSRRPRSSLANE